MITRTSAALLLGVSLTAVASSSAQDLTGTIVASNMTTSTVSLIDVATGRSVATLETAVAPHEVAVSHSGRWAVVAEYGDRSAVGHSLLVIDLRSGAMARRIDLGELKRPHGVRFLPGDRQLVVTSEVAKVIALVDFESGEVARTIETGAAASHMIATTANGDRAFVTNIVPGSVSVFDLGRATRTAVHEVGTMVEGIAATPDGHEVWAGGNRSNQVHVVDPSSGQVVATIPGFGMPYRIAITPDGQRAVVTDPGAEQIHIVDVASREITRTIDVPAVNGSPASPQGVTLAPDGRHAVVTLKGANQVVLLDIPSARIVATFATGGGSDGVGFSSTVVQGR